MTIYRDSGTQGLRLLSWHPQSFLPLASSLPPIYLHILHSFFLSIYLSSINLLLSVFASSLILHPSFLPSSSPSLSLLSLSLSAQLNDTLSLICLFFTTFFSFICLFFTLLMHEWYSALSPMPPSPLLSSPLLSAQLNDTLSLICLFFTTFFSLICVFLLPAAQGEPK